MTTAPSCGNLYKVIKEVKINVSVCFKLLWSNILNYLSPIFPLCLEVRDAFMFSKIYIFCDICLSLWQEREEWQFIGVMAKMRSLNILDSNYRDLSLNASGECNKCSKKFFVCVCNSISSLFSAVKLKIPSCSIIYFFQQHI